MLVGSTTGCGCDAAPAHGVAWGTEESAWGTEESTCGTDELARGTEESATAGGGAS